MTVESEGPTLRASVPSSLSGRRVDAVLAKLLRNHTRWRLQRLVRAGAVAVDGRVVGPRERLRAGQVLEVLLLEPPEVWYEPEPGRLDVLFEDEHLLVVDKPAGVTVHPVGERQSGTLLNRAQAYLDGTGMRGLLRPGVVHRLDRGTSGVLVLAKTHVAHAGLTRAFEAGAVRKMYVAAVAGRVAAGGGVIDRPIGRSPCGMSILGSCADDAIAPKRAVTRWRAFRRDDERSLLVCRPKTGRNHQLRIHLAWLGHPLVGEPYYLADGTFGPRGASAEGPLGLHARSIGFRHPVTGKPVRFVAAVPEGFGIVREPEA